MLLQQFKFTITHCCSCRYLLWHSLHTSVYCCEFAWANGDACRSTGNPKPSIKFSIKDEIRSWYATKRTIITIKYATLFFDSKHLYTVRYKTRYPFKMPWNNDNDECDREYDPSSLPLSLSWISSDIIRVYGSVYRI